MDKIAMLCTLGHAMLRGQGDDREPVKDTEWPVSSEENQERPGGQVRRPFNEEK